MNTTAATGLLNGPRTTPSTARPAPSDYGATAPELAVLALLLGACLPNGGAA
ncbi:hypothetical protein P3T36_001959 [Kitasatospora sp. MAP12-15]|uniref:hypothetical protein n=1 Tax=unclassified Kitasatospora TaxID=2633591 RepID=UPI0024741580|nr:hypothetical protein [Kitasatospora sp. MAP12-44]MDH6111643.1 hypothetical protein [Kitasatospora sp. MAP12-44]